MDVKLYTERLHTLLPEADPVLWEAMLVLETEDLHDFIMLADYLEVTESELMELDFNVLAESGNIDEGLRDAAKSLVGRIKKKLSKKDPPSLFQKTARKTSVYDQDQHHRAHAAKRTADASRYARMAKAAAASNDKKKLAYAQDMARRHQKASMKHQASVRGRISKSDEYKRARRRVGDAVSRESGKRSPKKILAKLRKDRGWSDDDS